MKYIRTKDGRIIDTTKYPEHPASWGVQASDYALTIKQSENLEELCDEFVCEWFDKEVNRYRHIYCRFKIGQSKELYRKDISLPPDVDFEIYAGIWVNDKGLTYVAKMDNDGKLVLV